MTALVDTREIFARAYAGQYAVGAFNINNMELIQGVVEAAAEARSAVILQASSFTRQYADLGYIVAMADQAAALARIPVALHLDHGADPETAAAFVDAGFTSVMIDGSHHDFEKNVAITREVCEYAHKHGVTVEGELGTIAGIEDGAGGGGSQFTDPGQAKQFVERTGVDSLAVAIGTSHGAYKFKKGQTPRLRFDILEEIGRLLPGFPIVLHGASSVNQDDIETINRYGGSIQSAVGIPEEMLRQAASLAVCKINVDTDLRLAMTGGVRRWLAEHPGEIDYRKYIGAGRDMVKERVAYKMQHVFGSAGRYDK